MPGWDPDAPFVASLRRPSMFALVSEGKIPNGLLGPVAKLFGDEKKYTEKEMGENFKEMSEIYIMMAKVALVKPTYTELEKAGVSLTDEQLLYIWNFTQTGVDAMRRFRGVKADAESDGGIASVSQKAE
ncbi:hypothetical protein [Caproicibacterium sp. XB2]